MSSKSIFVLKLFVFRSLGYLYPIFNKISKTRGAIWPKNWGCLGCFDIENSPKAGIFWQKMQDALYLYPLAPSELIASIQNIQAIGV